MENTNLIIDVNHENIATLILNRPHVHNAFDDQLISDLTSALKKIDQDNSIRVVLLTANGKNFCAGADLSWMQRMIHYNKDQNIADALELANLLKTLNFLSKPVIGLVQGAAYGGGIGLIACCDIVIAARDSHYCFSEAKLGLVPATIAPFVVAAIGARSAMKYFLTSEKFSAHDALTLNLIHQIVNPDELHHAGLNLAKTLLKNSPQALTLSKQLIHNIQSMDEQLLRETAELIAQVRTSKEGQEGLNAFLEKRAPNWIATT